MILEAVAIGTGLSMDALAVSLASGAAGRKDFTASKILLTAFFFGFFQTAMPMAGWSGGIAVGNFVQSFGRIIAGLLLIGIGIKMLFDKTDDGITAKSGLIPLLFLSFATSVDAFVVGVSFAFEKTGMHTALTESCVIGTVTFIISACGCIIGRFFGNIWGNRCSILGGFVLVGIGVKTFFNM